MTQPIQYRSKSASYEDILQHLWSCDKNHSPKLSDRLDITDYAKKIFEKSVTFEAWSENNLIGLVAAYLDNEKMGFITNVSVSGAHMKKGIAKSIMRHCINDAIKENICSLSLEVSSKNNTAINLYEKIGFKKHSEKNHNQNKSSIIMKLNLKG